MTSRYSDVDNGLVHRLVERSFELARSLDLGPIYYDNVWNVILSSVSGERAAGVEQAIDELITMSSGDLILLGTRKRARDRGQGANEEWADRLLALAEQKLLESHGD